MLRGNYPATVDGKGRLKIPTAFKAYLDENYGPDLYVTSLDGQSVRIYPFSVWREIEEKLAALPSMNKSKKKFLDRTNYWGQNARMDTQGRILIPSLLRESAAMRGEVAVIGYLVFIEGSDIERFPARLERHQFNDEERPTLSEFGN